MIHLAEPKALTDKRYRNNPAKEKKMSLPTPLSEPEKHDAFGNRTLYTADQIKAAMQAAYNEAIDDAAKVCESRQTPGTGSVAILQGTSDAIRAMLKEKTE
jgi:hypothetical protein